MLREFYRMETIPALKFYQGMKNKDKYRLVNGLFIVRYINSNECIFIGDFHKRDSALNHKKTNIITISNNSIPQKFNKKKNIATTGLRFWKNLNIKFIEKPIKDILN